MKLLLARAGPSTERGRMEGARGALISPLVFTNLWGTECLLQTYMSSHIGIKCVKISGGYICSHEKGGHTPPSLAELCVQTGSRGPGQAWERGPGWGFRFALSFRANRKPQPGPRCGGGDDTCVIVSVAGAGTNA